MPALRTPVDKLSLVVRKNLRDEYESKKPEYESLMKDLLGEPWTITLNPNQLYVYADDTYNSRLGSVITWYMDSFIENLKTFVSKYGSDGITELNSICSQHKLHFGPQEKTSFSYGGLVIENGVLNLVFAEDSFAVNVDDVSSQIATAIRDVSLSSSPTTNNNQNKAYNLIARQAVRNDYDPEIEQLRISITQVLNIPDVKLNPNFEQNASLLAKSPDRVQEGYDARIGWITLEYFQGFKECIDRQGFKGDDMLQEGFADAVDKHEVTIKILERWEDANSGSPYNRVKVVDGVLEIQTTVENWGVNVADAALKLLDIL